MSNHIIIGLGGTGGKVIRAFKQRYYEEFHDEKGKGREGVNLDYIYVDSDPKDLNAKWLYYGNDIGLSNGKKLNINEVNSESLHNLHNHPRLNAFLSDTDASLFDQDPNLRSVINEGIGGQRRRFGRVLFANKANEFMNLVNNSMNELQNRSTSGETAITFHICAGLAGGTGSGSIVDVVSQLASKNKNKDHPEYKIYLYLYVPGSENISDNDPKFKYYFANGYAALLELNAISAHRYYPVDVTRGRDSQGNIIRLLDGRDAFKVAYLYSETNCKGKKLDRNEKLPHMVGDFIFQRTVAPALVKGGEQELERVIESENAGMGINESSDGRISLATNFLSLGVKRVEVPVMEIKEYISYRFALQATCQMLFNTFEEGRGYIESPSVQDFKREVTQQTTREQLHLSDDFMMGLKPLDNKGIVYPEEDVVWKTKAAALHKKITNADNRRDWKDQFQEEFGQFYASGWHGRGVNLFFVDRRSNITQYAYMISNFIEKQLFNEWITGAKSLNDISRYLTILIDYIGVERMTNFDTNIKKLTVNNADYEKVIVRVNARWQNLLASRKILFEDYVNAMCSLYCSKMKIEGYRFASELTAYIIKNLSATRECVNKEITRLREEMEYFKMEYLRRCKKEDTSEDAEIEKVYGGPEGLEKIHKMAETFITNKKLMETGARKVRNAINTFSLGGINSFEELQSRLDNIEQMENMINNVCIVFAEQTLDDTNFVEDNGNILKENILKILKKQYPSGSKLKEYMKRLVDNAYYNVRFSGNEISNGGGIEPQRMIELILPEYAEENGEDYRQAFINEFKDAIGASKHAVMVNKRFNQIVVVSLPSNYPARYLDITSVLRQRYDDLTHGLEGEVNKMVLHTETEDIHSLQGRKVDYMSLFFMTQNEMMDAARPYILLLFALNLVEKTKDPDGMSDYIWAYIPRDESGNPIVDKVIMLGSGIVNSVYKAVTSKNDPQACKKITDLVKLTLQRDEYRDVAAKRTIRSSIGELVRKEVLPECNGDEHNPNYQAFLKAMNYIKENILTIAE